MKITIEETNDPSVKDKEFLGRMLEDYNKSQVGDFPQNTFSLFITKGNDFVGGYTGSSAWNWFFINNFWINPNYRNKKLGSFCLKHLEKKCSEHKFSAISTRAFNIQELNFYLSNGFVCDGVLEERPPRYNTFYIKKEKLKKNSITLDQSFSFTTENDQNFSEKLNNSVQNDYKVSFGEQPYKEIYFFGRHNNEIIGGLFGCIGWNWFYTDILWVNQDYRGRGIGKTLMRKAEEYSKKNYINKLFLGTSSFQAPVFYEKLGYKTFSTRENLPPGKTNFSMKKIINVY